MPSPTVEDKTLSEADHALMVMALAAMALVFGAEPMAILFQEKDRMFIVAQPGKETGVMEYLQGVDWARVVMLAHEWAP